MQPDNQREITFLLCFYLAGRDTVMTEEAFLYQCLEKKGHRLKSGYD